MARINPIVNKADLNNERQDEFDAISKTLHRVSGPFSILMWSPGLAQKVMEAGAHLRVNTVLTPAERELAILTASRELNAAYQWAAHVPVARRAGITDAVIGLLRERGDASTLEPPEASIVAFVRQLLACRGVEQNVFDTLRECHGERWLVELAATVGQYQYIATVNTAFAVTPAPGDPVEHIDSLPRLD
jgi:Uncharacterized conserved protein